MQLQLFSEQEYIAKPQNQYEAIVYFIARLDIEMVSSFLDEERTYQDFPKYLFVSKLIGAFEQFDKAGDKSLALHKGSCSGCSKGCRGLTFLGEQGHYMDLLFQQDSNKIVDIYECVNFINDVPIPEKVNRVEIDRSFFLTDNSPF